MTTFIAILVDGSIYASWLFLVSAGLTVIYGVMRILNMAHGSFYAIGAYAGASLVGWWFSGAGGNPYVSYLLLLGAALVAGLVVGFFIEFSLLRRMYGRDEILMVIVTYALLLILEDAIKLVWGVDPYFAYQPYGLLGRVSFSGLTFANYDLGLIGVSLVVGFGLWLILNRTHKGKLLRAVIHDREVAVAMGVNVKAMFAVTFAVGTTLGALAGADEGVEVAPGEAGGVHRHLQSDDHHVVGVPLARQNLGVVRAGQRVRPTPRHPLPPWRWRRRDTGCHRWNG